MFFRRHRSQPAQAPTRNVLLGLVLLSLLSPERLLAQNTEPVTASTFVDIKKVDPTILIELRYAGANNPTHSPLYPSGMPALVRYSVAQRLAAAQKYLQARGFGLKVWDAYRPKVVQEKLWAATKNNDFVADPKDSIGSLHTRGAAVDVTLVDQAGKEAKMPTEFDNFTPAAMLYYQGSDPMIRSNLKLLQKAMARAGFYGLRTEWWHFCAGDWMTYPPVSEMQLVARLPSLNL